MPRRLSVYAVLLGAAAAAAATVGVRVLLQYTAVHRFHEHPLFAVAEATLVYIVGVHPLLKSYNKNWDFMFRRPKARDPNEVW